MIGIFEFLAPGHLHATMKPRRMGQAAGDYVLRRTKDKVLTELPEFVDEAVVVDNNSTDRTAEVASSIKVLKLAPLTVITNALNIARSLAEMPNISLIMIGGILRQISGSFVGPQAEQMLRELHADHFFLAVDGFDPHKVREILDSDIDAYEMQERRW